MPSPQSDMESLKMPIIPRFLTSFQNVSLLSEYVGKITGRTSLRLNVTVTVMLPTLARNHECVWMGQRRPKQRLLEPPCTGASSD